jgi:hypothetical protein
MDVLGLTNVELTPEQTPNSCMRFQVLTVMIIVIAELFCAPPSSVVNGSIRSIEIYCVNTISEDHHPEIMTQIFMSTLETS